MSAASKGRAFEHQIRDLFREAGFSVIRGAGSKGYMLDEKVDLVATKLTPQNKFSVYLTVVDVQCKVKAHSVGVMTEMYCLSSGTTIKDFPLEKPVVVDSVQGTLSFYGLNWSWWKRLWNGNTAICGTSTRGRIR
jgi:hypothetical protein